MLFHIFFNVFALVIYLVYLSHLDMCVISELHPSYCSCRRSNSLSKISFCFYVNIQLYFSLITFFLLLFLFPALLSLILCLMKTLCCTSVSICLLCPLCVCLPHCYKHTKKNPAVFIIVTTASLTVDFYFLLGITNSM